MAVNIFWAFALFICLVYADPQCKHEKIFIPEGTIQRLFELVLENQAKTEVPAAPGHIQIKRIGSYKNVMKVNIFGDSFRTALRWAININEENTFVPMWVSTVLMEAHRYGSAPRPSDQQLISSVDFSSHFAGIDKPYNHSLMHFWECIYDEAHQSCVTRPAAYIEFMNLITPLFSQTKHHTIDKSNLNRVLTTFDEIVRILTGFSNLNKLIVNIFEQFESTNAAHDADDSSVWLGLGSVLTMSKKEFPLVWNKWIQYNPNISSIFSAFKEYAYKPFSTNPIASRIDPQTYYVLRDFLDDAKARNRDVALVTTWFTNEDFAILKGGELHTHKIVNDVDFTVSANAVNAITASVLSGLVSHDVLYDQDVAQVYHNTSAMLAYFINSNFSDRPDLALLYYPSRYQFYWTVARTVSIMDIYKRDGQFPVQVMEFVFSDLKQAMEGEATRFLTSNVQQDDDGSLYFDDFLGNGDLTEDNKPITRGEDRIFTTAMAANVLMYTWLSFDSVSGNSHWKTNTSPRVKNIVDGCVLWLIKHTLEGKFKPWNAFFSAQNKGKNILPFRYPANLFIEIPQQYSFQYVTALRTIVGVQGYVPKPEYEAMMNRTHFGKPIPTVFKGFNHPDYGQLLFWSSDPYTYSITLLALSRYREIETTEDICIV